MDKYNISIFVRLFSHSVYESNGLVVVAEFSSIHAEYLRMCHIVFTRIKNKLVCLIPPQYRENSVRITSNEVILKHLSIYIVLNSKVINNISADEFNILQAVNSRFILTMMKVSHAREYTNYPDGIKNIWEV